MFEAKLKSSSILKKVIEAIKDIVQDANFLCTEDGIQMQAMDQAHVALITLTLLADGFTSYRCNTDFTLGINILSLTKILKCAENSDSILLRADPEGDVLYVELESPNGSRKSQFELRRLDIEADTVQFPDIEYSASVKMPSSEFQRVIRDLATLGDTSKISIQEQQVSFSVNGDIGKASVILAEDRTCKKEEEQTIIEVSENTEGIFALRYLSYFTKATGISEQVGIYMSTNIPIHISYDMGDIGSVGYYLAPKLTED
jgi:proliferating cell nuclear antigen